MPLFHPPVFLLRRRKPIKTSADTGEITIRHARAIGVLVAIIVCASLAASLAGILSSHGSEEYEYTSIRGENVTIMCAGLTLRSVQREKSTASLS